MVRDRVALKKDLDKFLAQLIERHAVFGPTDRDRADGVKKIETPDGFDLQHGAAHFSFKSFFFPQTEVLFSFDLASKKICEADSDTEDEKVDILIGLRPCDAMAVDLLDQVFVRSGTKDAHYARRRQKTRIISFACSEPAVTCFCNSVGCAPDSEVGADVIFYDLEDRYFIKAATGAGEELLNTAGTHLSNASENDRAEKERVITDAKNKLGHVFSVDSLDEKLANFDASFWNRICQSCLGCGVCTYLCPTCHCFDITDETNGRQGRRIRTWDSCMYPLFTLHASGHNPRPTHKERMRQRIMHKFSYSTKQYGRRFCVGCGRCIMNCPVNLDLRTVVKEITEAK
jgi:sulfhydrogenase subunit beta (sulfur reductase)